MNEEIDLTEWTQAYYKNFKPSATNSQPLSFKDYQLAVYENAYPIYQGRPSNDVLDNRRRRGQVETQISTMGDIDYKSLLKDIGSKPRMQEVMNRIAPESLEEPLLLFDFYTQKLLLIVHYQRQLNGLHNLLQKGLKRHYSN